MKMKHKLIFLVLFLFVSCLTITSVKARSTQNGFLFDPRTQPKFINSLPSPHKLDGTKGGNFTLEMRQTEQWLGLYAGLVRWRIWH